MVGAISLAVVAALILAAFNAQNLPIIGGGDVYYAAFSEAGGLKANDEVRVAGVRVGKVEKVELDGDHVKVTFRIEDGAEFGKETRRRHQGQDPARRDVPQPRPGRAPASSPRAREIPVARTSSPYDVVKAFSGLAETSERIDTDQLAQALTTLADLTRNTPEEFRAALDGVSRLSTNVAAKNSQINELLGNLQNVAEVLDARDQDIIGLMRDSDVLFRALVKRREAVHRLLVSTTTLSTELTKLVKQSRADLKPALTHLDTVVGVLNKNEDNIDNSLRLMAPFYRVFANTLGNGPWFDTYIQNMPPVPQVG